MPEQEVETVIVDDVVGEVEEVVEETAVTYSQADFDKELEKRVNEQVELAKQETRDEAKRLSELSAEEVQAERVASLEKEIADMRAERSKLELEKSVTDILVKADLPVGLTDSLVKVGDAETIKGVVDEIKQQVTERVEAGIQANIKQPTPQSKATLPSEDGVDKSLTFTQMIDKAAKSR